jgi:DeoR family fructose operon transcriptional repressor
MLQAGRQKVLLVDSSKIGIEATYRLCGVEDCDLIITDSQLPEADLARLRELTRVVIADTPPLSADFSTPR